MAMALAAAPLIAAQAVEDLKPNLQQSSSPWQLVLARLEDLESDVQSLGDTTNELVDSHLKYDYFFSNPTNFQLPKWDGQTSKWDRAYWGDLEYVVQPGDVIETSLSVKSLTDPKCFAAVTDFLFGGEGEEPTPLASSHAGAYHPSKWLVFENKYEHPIDAAPMTYRIGLFNFDTQS